MIKDNFKLKNYTFEIKNQNIISKQSHNINDIDKSRVIISEQNKESIGKEQGKKSVKI
jgi:hypothetical protein